MLLILKHIVFIATILGAFAFYFYPFLLTAPATFIGKPNKRMNPVASVGSYSAPILKLARSVWYRLFGLVAPANVHWPL